MSAGFGLANSHNPDINLGFIVGGGIVGGLLFYCVGLLIAVVGWLVINFWLVIVVVLLLIFGGSYWKSHPEEVRSWYECTKARCEAVVAHIKLSDTAIMRYARKQTKRLMAIAPDIEWLDIRTSINELGSRHIPNLLQERKSLRDAIKRVNGVLRQIEWHKKDRQDFEKANARRSSQTIEDLVMRHQTNEADIKETLDTMRHLEADLALATVDTYKREQIKAQLRGLVSRIQQNTVAVEQARAETDDCARQRPRLTE